MKTVKNTTLIEYIEAVCNQNYTPFAGVEEFNHLLLEYYELQNEVSEYKIHFQLLQSFALVQSRLTALLLAKRIYAVSNINEFVLDFDIEKEKQEITKELSKLGYKITSQKDIERQLKSCLIDFKIKEKSLNDFISKSQKEKINESKMINHISRVSKHMGVMIDINTCTLFQFAGYLNVYMQEVEQLKKQNNGRR